MSALNTALRIRQVIGYLSCMKSIYLGAGTRTPIGKFGGTLARFSAPELATLALKEALKRAPDARPAELVLLGHARQAGARPNPARQATIFAGLPESIPAWTLNHACASGLSAIITAAEKIQLGRTHSVWAGGTESMSNTPYLMPKARWGLRMGHTEILDGMVHDGFHCPMADMLMGATVESYIAKEQSISRKDQDEFALYSQQQAEHAWKNGSFKKETFEIPAEGKYPTLVTDEHRRWPTTLETLAKLAPVFDPKNGSVTAGNSSGITDGAAFVHVSNQKSSHTQAEIIDYETVALDPKHMGLGPIPATEALFKRNKLQSKDIEAFEINEAFAAQVIACERTLQIPREKINAWGGSIAIGHPIGCTGTRIVVTLMNRLQGKSGALGVATLCVSGGQGVALLIKAI